MWKIATFSGHNMLAPRLQKRNESLTISLSFWVFLLREGEVRMMLHQYTPADWWKQDMNRRASQKWMLNMYVKDLLCQWPWVNDLPVHLLHLLIISTTSWKIATWNALWERRGYFFLYLYLTKCIFNISPVCITNQQQFVSWWSSPSFCFNIYNKCEDGQQNSQTSVEKTSDLTSDAQWSAFDYSSLCIFTICAECGHQLKQQSCLHKTIWCSNLLLRPGSGGWHN